MDRGRRRGEAPAPELLWDTVDRLLLPVIFSHAAAVLVSTILSCLYIAQVSSFALFALFGTLALGFSLFYHNLKVRSAGKCILITGCDSLIGSSIARNLDDLGFTVFAGFEEEGEESKKLKEECSGRLHIFTLDVTSEQSVHAALSFVISRLPSDSTGLWAVINAAVLPAYGEVEWIPFNKFKKAIDINLLGAVRVTQVFLPLIRKNKGRIINISSIHGRIHTGMESALGVSKSGLEAFSDCLRLEMRKWGVDVVVIEPGHLSSSTWFNNDQILEDARTMWHGLSSDAQVDYGKKYFEYKIRKMEEFKPDVERDVSVVVKCCGDAVTRTFPLPRYTPITRQEKIQALVAHHLPRSVYDIIYS